MKRFLIFITLLLLSHSIFSQEIDLELVLDGFYQPLNIQNAGDNRLFIVEKEGKIKIILENGSLSSTPFLNISDKITKNGERGLLGLAFHPQYSQNGYFYINYTDLNGDTKISRFQVNQSNPNLADADSEIIILEYEQHESNHNGGDLLFGPDGYLYISSGDGGEFGDPNHRAQSLDEYLGKILRIDVDNPSAGKNYGIPQDNPFLNIPDANPEIWAYGLRNPWRFSIDHEDNNLWIADVGQADREEINRQPSNAGGINYGWSCFEGSIPFNTTNCPPETDLTFPIAEYTHENGNCSISGGHVYRGSEFPELAGRYFFADYCSGMIASLNPDNSIENHGNFDGKWVAFGQDKNNELYIADISGGKIYKIRSTTTTGISSPEKIDFEIIPNPAEHFIIVTSNSKIDQITIYDIHGREVYKNSFMENSEKIDVYELNSGTYFLKAQFGTKNSSYKKFIIR